MDKRFTGMIPPVVTPFTAEGEVDLEALDRVIEHRKICPKLGTHSICAAARRLTG